MYNLTLEKRKQVIACLVEGNSIRSTSRLTGVAKGTILSLLVTVGKACQNYLNETVRDLPCTHVECDEIWSFCYMKGKNIPESQAKKFGIGSVWTWTTICPETKLMINWLVGERTLDCAITFLSDLQTRLIYLPQISTDGLVAYQEAVLIVFGYKANFAMIEKNVIVDAHGKKELSIRRRKVTGNPDMSKLSTSFVERQNLTMRTQIKRFTRKTNAFSKKVENLKYAVSLHFMYYNFCRPHQSLNEKRNLGITPAMAEDITDHRWTIEEVIHLAYPDRITSTLVATATVRV